MIKNLLQSIRLLADGAESFRKNCVEGLEANEKRIATLLNESLMLATILNRRLGYDSAFIAPSSCGIDAWGKSDAVDSC